VSGPLEQVSAVLRRFAERASIRVAALTGDVAGCEAVLRGEMARTVAELRTERLDAVMADALTELDAENGWRTVTSTMTLVTSRPSVFEIAIANPP
jgi:uncharacterized protein YgbK (DUF1537 family)